MAGIFRKLLPTAGAVSHRLGHDSLIHVLEGRRGRGKSYAATSLILDTLANGTNVVTNSACLDYYRVSLELVRRGVVVDLVAGLRYLERHVRVARTWDELIEAYDAVVVLDEAVRHFDSRPGLAVRPPSLFFEWVRQTRKVKTSVYFVVHSVEWLDKRVTQLADLHWFVRKEAWPNRWAPDGTPFPRRFWLYGQDPGGVGSVENLTRHTADYVCSLPFDPRVARCYESRALVPELGDHTSYETVRGIWAHHEAAGRPVGVDGEVMLRAHLERLTGERADGGPLRATGRTLERDASTLS